jgi:hypothetical protein
MMAITTNEVKKAALELARMRGSLTAWLKFRTINDSVMAGTLRTRKPLGYAQSVVAGSRDMSVEQDLATKLHALLSEVMKGKALPNPNLSQNPNGAVELSQLALMSGSAVASPVATDGFLGGHPWLWPALIVAGVLITVTTAIKTAADVAKDREEKACIEAGACTDYGFWLKAGGLVAVAWFAWREMGLRDLLTKRGRN